MADGTIKCIKTLNTNWHLSLVTRLPGCSLTPPARASFSQNSYFGGKYFVRTSDNKGRSARCVLMHPAYS